MAMSLPDTPDAMVDFIRRRSVNGSPFTRFLDVDLVAAFDGRAELTLDPRPDLLQHRGTIHGGVVSSAIDNVAGWAAATLLGPLVTTSLHVHFHAPATQRLRIIGEVQHHTTRSALVNVTAHLDADHRSASDGRGDGLVATATVAFRTTKAD